MLHKRPALRSWQQDFVDRFVSQKHSKSLLVAAPGTGKTTTALLAADKLLEDGAVDSLLVVSSLRVLREQWRHAAAQYGIDLGSSLGSGLGPHGLSATIQSLRTRHAQASIDAAAKSQRWLVVADDPGYETKSLVALVDRILSLNKDSRALFLASDVPTNLSFDAEFRFKTEFIVERAILESPATELRVARFAPSFALLRRLDAGAASLDGVSWRDFERLIATLLENDGYAVELMQGSKDGGVDVVAVKNLGANGFFKSLWQAKKQGLTNKVGISVVRELADTRQQFGASKGIIVTSSYLTRGALQRIDRDKYILGKVDRLDLEAWIRRAVLATRDGSPSFDPTTFALSLPKPAHTKRRP